MTAKDAQPLVRAAGKGFFVENPVGGVIRFAVTSSESGGAVTAFETMAAPGEGPPLHAHEQDELIYVLSGRFRIKVGDVLEEAAIGAVAFIPRRVPHTWQNVGDTEARFVGAVMPAAPAFEEFFRRFGELPAHERGVEAFARLARETSAFEVVGPPLAAQ